MKGSIFFFNGAEKGKPCTLPELVSGRKVGVNAALTRHSLWPRHENEARDGRKGKSRQKEAVGGV
jgi:hypothetical protein